MGTLDNATESIYAVVSETGPTTAPCSPSSTNVPRNHLKTRRAPPITRGRARRVQPSYGVAQATGGLARQEAWQVLA